MKRVGLTEARNGLSALLAQVRAGETFVITDREVPIGRLEAMTSGAVVDPGDLVGRLQRMGVLRAPRVASPDLCLATPPPMPKRGIGVLTTLLQERRTGR